MYTCARCWQLIHVHDTRSLGARCRAKLDAVVSSLVKNKEKLRIDSGPTTKDFDYVRCDRNLRNGGGVCILIKKSLNYVEIAVDDQFNRLEVCCIDIILGTNFRYRFVCTYRPPGNSRESLEYAIYGQLYRCYFLVKAPNCYAWRSESSQN